MSKLAKVTVIESKPDLHFEWTIVLKPTEKQRSEGESSKVLDRGTITATNRGQAGALALSRYLGQNPDVSEADQMRMNVIVSPIGGTVIGADGGDDGCEYLD